MVALLVAGCVDPATPSDDGAPPLPVERETVTTTNRTIVVATKLDGVVITAPSTELVSPGEGSLVVADLMASDGRSVSGGERVGTLEIPCVPSADDVDGAATAGDERPDPLTTVPSTPCRARVVPIVAPRTGRLVVGSAVERAAARGDRTVQVSDGEAIAAVEPGGWELHFPFGEDDQPGLFAEEPPPAYVLVTDTTLPVFQARFGRMVTGDDGDVTLIAAPIDPPTLVAGTKVSASFVTDRRLDVPTLPISAVRWEGNNGRVLIEDGTNAVVQEVIIGAEDGAWVEVHGLDQGTEVIRYPLDGELAAG